MARKRSTQRGRIELKGCRWTLRYCLRDAERESGWRDCREFLPIGITEVEADAIRKKRMETINSLNNSLVIQPAMTLKQFTETLWQEYQEQRNLEESTRYSYASMLKNLVLPSFGRLRVDRITPTHLTRLMKAAREQGYSSKYRLNLYSVLAVLFDVARDYDLVATSPVRAKLHRPVHERKEKRSFTAEQIRALSQHVSPEDRLSLFTAGVLGLRFGELAGLQHGDLKGETVIDSISYGLLNLQRSVWRGRVKPRLKTAESKKPMLVHPTHCELLREHRRTSAWNRDSDFIFARPNGRPLDPDHLRERVLYPALRAAGIEVVKRESGIHALRHSAGTILYQMTRDLEIVKRFLRHSRIATTSDIYVHPGEAVAVEAVDTMAEVYFPGLTKVTEVEGVQ